MSDKSEVIAISQNGPLITGVDAFSREGSSSAVLDYEKKMELEERTRSRLLALIEKAYDQAKANGLLYTMRYLKAATIAVETEAGDHYFRQAADEECDGQSQGG